MSTSSFALDVDTLNLRLKKFSLKEVCTEMGFKNLLVVAPHDQVRVDCMGRFVKAIDFCNKKLALNSNPLSYLTRAYVLKDSKEVVCELGSDVNVKLPCVGVYRERCIDPKNSCLKIKPHFAFSHELYHAFEMDNILNCRYQVKLKDDSVISL